jgi:C1A family cysteine protease
VKNQLKTAFQLRFEYYNLYEGKEDIWHKKYKKDPLYDVVVKSFEYDFKEIANIMPELIKQNEKNL